MASSLLLTTAPAPSTFAQPTDQTGVGIGVREEDLCRDPAQPLLRYYDDVPNGIGLRYPDRWTWRVQSGALPGTRSEVVWFGPNYAAGVAPNCVISLRLVMHHFLADTSLEEMRNTTALLDLASIFARQIQAQAAAAPGVSAQPILSIPPLVQLPRFWSQLSRRNLWGGERLTLPSGHAYYREIGTGPVQDLQLNERQGSLVRYVVAVSPRVSLEILGEATTPQFESYYARTFDQMVQSLAIQDAVSENPGPIGRSVEGGACEALVLVNDLSVRDTGRRVDVSTGRGPLVPPPFLERSAVSQRLQINGLAVPVNVTGPGEDADVGCGGPIGRMALFLEPPVRGAEPMLPDVVSVYGLPYDAPPPLADGRDLSQAGFYQSWSLPADLYGTRVVYVAAQMADGRWSYVTRQVNIAPAMSIEIGVNPREVEIGQRVTVVMRVLNNTSERISDVRPVLYPTAGPGIVLLRSGPIVSPSGCELLTTPAQVTQAPDPATAQQPAAAQRVTLEPITTGTRNCAMFVWDFTALRAGSISFSGTAEGRRDVVAGQVDDALAAATLDRADATSADAPVRLLSRAEAQPVAQAPAGGQVTAPVATAGDVQVRPVDFAEVDTGGLVVLPDALNPRAIVVWLPVRNNGGATIYNVEASIEVRGVPAVPLPETLVSSDRAADTAFLRAGQTCPSDFGVRRRPGERLELQLQEGNIVPFMRPNECVVFRRVFEIPADESLDRPFFVDASVRSTTPHSTSHDLTAGVVPVVYPIASTQAGPFTVELLQALVPIRLRRGLGPYGPIEVPAGPGGATTPGGTTPGGTPAPVSEPPGGGTRQTSAARQVPLAGTGAGTTAGGLVSDVTAGGGRSSAAATSAAEASTNGTAVSATAGSSQAPYAYDTGPGSIARQAPRPGEGGNGIAQQPGPGGGGTQPPGGGGTQPPGGGGQPTPGGGGTQPGPGGAGGTQILPAGESGFLGVRLRAFPVSDPESSVFRLLDTIRVVMEVKNETGLPLRDVRPYDLTVTVGDRVLTDIFLEGGPGQLPSLTNAAGGAGATAGAVGRGGTGRSGGTTASGQGRGGQVTFCVIEIPPTGGEATQIRQLRGPDPPVIPRLAPNATGTFTWEFQVTRFDGEDPRLVFGGNASGEFAGERISGVFISDPTGPSAIEAMITVGELPLVPSPPIERAIGCVFVTMEATPSQVQSGSIVEVRMRAHNNSQFFPPRQYTDLWPTPLLVMPGPARGNEVLDVNLQLLSGPTNVVTGGPVTLNDNEVTYFTWRYLATGTGCFRLQGQLSARPLRSNLDRFYSNHVQTNLVCLPQGPRVR